MSGPRYLRAVPDPRDGVVLDWIREVEPVDAKPVLDAVFETLADIRQVRRWPWDAAMDALRPIDRDVRVRRWTVLIAAALITALVVGATLSGGLFVRPQTTPLPRATTSAPTAIVSPSAPAGLVYPLASMNLVIAGVADDQLYVIRPDGSPPQRVGEDIVAGLAQPDWAPDGGRVLVIGRSNDVEQQWEVDPAGREPSQVVLPCVAPCGSRNEAAYSRDGTKILFFEARGDPVGGIPPSCALLLYDRSTQDIEPVHEFACGTEEDREPRFSPDGRSIAFWRSRHSLPGPSQVVEESAIFIRDLATGAERRVTEWADDASSVDWSPDGQWLAFTTKWWEFSDPAYHTDVWRIRADGTGLEQVTHLESDQAAWRPRYTPDGSWILFSLLQTQGADLWAVPAEGGTPVNVLPGGPHIYEFSVREEPDAAPAGSDQPSATPSPSST